MFLIYLLIGAVAGILAGLLGIGGGIIVVPALANVFLRFNIMSADYVMHVAVGTSLAAIIATGASAMIAHNKRGSVRWDLFRKFIPGLVTGSIIGAMIADYLPSNYLSILFGFFLLYVAFTLLVTKQHHDAPSELPPRRVIWAATGFMGILASILGVGGGILLVPFMLRCRVSLVEATGTSVACVFVLGIVATISFMTIGAFSPVNLPWTTGFIYWPALIGVVIPSMLLAPLGTALAHKLPKELLKRIFALFIILIAIDMLFFPS